MNDIEHIAYAAFSNTDAPVDVAAVKSTLPSHTRRNIVRVDLAEVGVYGEMDIGDAGLLEVVVEKGFACLDRSDDENIDTFANPHAGTTC